MVTEALLPAISIKVDDKEFRNIFNQYYVALCLFANRYTTDENVSADIVQDCFAKLWQIRTDFFYLHQVKSFLYTAVHNKALNELEHSKIVNEYAQALIEKKSDSFFSDTVLEEETYRIVAEAIGKLPEQMKAIMRLSLEGDKNQEIAEKLNVSPETVHTLKKIAYKKLRVYLKDYYYLLFLLIQ
ncbi:MAG: RNA polymerase sigma-70 factor [Bacteroides sp.]